MDFNQVLIDSKGDNANLSAVIYGTRAHNYDKVIAKYKYQIVKRKVESVPILGGELSKRASVKLKEHSKKEKLPTIRFKQSILERSD